MPTKPDLEISITHFWTPIMNKVPAEFSDFNGKLPFC